jgi:hypothetical protein
VETSTTESILGRYLEMVVKFTKLSYNISLPDNRLGAAERETMRTAYGTHLLHRELQNRRTIIKLRKEMSGILSRVGGDYTCGVVW